MSFYKNILFIVCFLSAFFLNAQNYYLHHNDISNLNFEKSKDLKLGVTLPFFGQTNFQLGYSPLKPLNFSIGYYRHKINGTSGSIETKASSYIAAIGLYQSFKNPFYSKFTVFDNIKSFQFQSHLGYSFNKNENCFFTRSFAKIDLQSQNLFLRIGVLIKYKRLSFGLSKSFNYLYFRHIDIIGDHSINPYRIEKLMDIIADNGFQRLEDTTISIKYGILGHELFVDFHNVYAPNATSRFDFFESEYANIGVVLNLDKFLKSYKKENLAD